MKASKALASAVFGVAGGSLVPSPIEHLKDLAAECRVLAKAVHDATTRRDLLSVAERFERLARMRGQVKPVPVRSS
jgi:hypothetical protein